MTEHLRMTAFCPYLGVLRFFRTTFDRHGEEHRSRPKGSIKKLLWEILQNSQKKKYPYESLTHDTHRSCSEPLPSYSELKHDTHRSYSELLPGYSELKLESPRSCSELLPSYSELKHNAYCSCAKRLPCYFELQAMVLIIVSLSYVPTPLRWNTWRINLGY